MASRTMSIVVEDELYEEVNKKSKSTDLTMSQIVRRALKEYLNPDDYSKIKKPE